jgi:hypothetical protein
MRILLFHLSYDPAYIKLSYDSDLPKEGEMSCIDNI